MPRAITFAFVGVLTLSPVAGQQPSPNGPPLAVKDLGTVVRLCGQVADYACDIAGLFVAVPSPDHIEVQPQDKLPPVFAPDAYTQCDPVVVMPKVTREVKPRYTQQAMRERAEGAVLMQAVVKADGGVGEIQFLRRLHPDLDFEAERALKQWRFTPGQYQGKPADVVATFELTFTLRK